LKEWILRLHSELRSADREPNSHCRHRERLKGDIKSWGNSPTPRQSLETASRRKSLAARLVEHKGLAGRYLPAHALSTIPPPSLSQQGRPELLPTSLPSSCVGSNPVHDAQSKVQETERSLRRVHCLKALQTVRSIAVQRAHMLKGKQQHVRGVIATTRAQGLLVRLTRRLEQARWVYNNSRARLSRLGQTPQDARTFKVLKHEDLRGLTTSLQGKDSLGDGYRRMPWYWRVNLSVNQEDSDEVSIDSQSVHAEYEESGFFNYALSWR
jgi:hypothetical protein